MATESAGAHDPPIWQWN